jgi:hypothetical protein
MLRENEEIHMSGIFRLASMALLALLVAACAAAPKPITATPTAVSTTGCGSLSGVHTADSSTLEPTTGCISIPTVTPLPTGTPGISPFEALLTVEPNRSPSPEQAVLQTDVNLRKGPGMLFDIRNGYGQGQTVLVLGQAPGGDWYQVQTADSLTGWMRSAILTLDGLAIDLPLIVPTEVLTIKGHVYSPGKNPASAIGVTLLEENSNDAAQRDVGNTNAFGEWYIYLPTSMARQWTLRADSYSCKSNAVNSACGLIGQFPQAQTVTLPLPADTWIDFYMLP